MGDFSDLKRWFLDLPEVGEFATLRVVSSYSEGISVRSDVLSPIMSGTDTGYMVTVYRGDGSGYAASSDFSKEGIQRSYLAAREWARFNGTRSLVPFSRIERMNPSGKYSGRAVQPWEQMGLADKIDYLKMLNSEMSRAPNVVDRIASLSLVRRLDWYVTSEGAETVQEYDVISPFMSLTASKGTEVQKRSKDSFTTVMQGGVENLEYLGFDADNAALLGEEVNILLDAENCPEAMMDLLLDPGQMVLQIHESIGHPLEIDRILGDERNYAGTSFVTPDMIGSFRYGSPLLNITFDPTICNECGTYRFDDDGNEAEKEYLIEGGILKRALGSHISQYRSDLPGVASSRASNWNRPPVDRMANLNMEARDSTLDQMIAAVEQGIFMKTNLSWSIDDSRNKFQFGCEWGQLIKDGALTEVVKNPNYRGISRCFWNNLKMVGNSDTFKIRGVTNCGKAEPNQSITVGHAAPAALFADVEIFGGE